MMIQEKLQKIIDNKTKPVGSLGKLEALAMQIGTVQNSISPKLMEPSIIVFAGDHGIATEGVSAYPQEVTFQMVMNFLQKGAAINVFCEQNQIRLTIVDSGVNFDFSNHKMLIDRKIGYGTESFLHGKAMSIDQLDRCFAEGKDVLLKTKQTDCNVIGFGEMGIGNTSSASMIMSCICDLPLEKCIGKGTGLNDQQLQHKLQILSQAKEYHGSLSDPMEILQTFGGFEIAQMVSAMLSAFENNMIILVDGFICTSAFLIAHALQPDIIQNAIFCHQSDESGHQDMLHYLQANPILHLNLRLGEGTGCALAYPIIKNAVAFLNDMASFESAGVKNKDS